ncbi:MAG: PASTA domain-containing protein [Bacteroidales bacterium]|nr:PASTA domain-containing protein [Bacteroidales bacterium]
MAFNRVGSYIKHIVQYISDRIVLRNFVIAFLILIVGLFLILQILKIYTRHNQNLSVPDFTGLTLEETAEAALSRDLSVEVFDSVYLSEYERGTVVDQHPVPAFRVKKNRKIFLTMNAVNPEKIVMPDLVDLTFRQARSRLESFGLKTGDITYEPNIGVNVVLAQKVNGMNVNPGDSIIKGTPIDLVLGQGLSEEQTGVPKLVGLTFEEAKIMASDRFLSIGAVVPDATIITEDDEVAARVFRQVPEPGPESTLALGSSIDIWLTLDSIKVQESIEIIDSLLN